MKRSFALLLTITFLLLFATTVYAHSGRTDYKGGHTNHSTGEYHYHHGYPEHQHTNGECPYDFDDKTGWNSGTGGSSNTNNSPYPKNNASNTDTKTFGEYLWELVCIYFVLIIVIGLFHFPMILKFIEINIFAKYFGLKLFLGTGLISLATVIFVNCFEEPTFYYIIPAICTPILLLVSYWPIRKSKYKKFQNSDFFRVYRLIDKKGEHEEDFFNDWCTVAEEPLGIYYCYTCYVSKTTKTIHYKKGCSNANIPSHLLKTNGNICQKCGKIKREVSLDRKMYDKFIDVCDVLNFWGIKP